MRNDSVVDRGRRSIAVNMKDRRGIETVLRLVEQADILPRFLEERWTPDRDR